MSIVSVGASLKLTANTYLRAESDPPTLLNHLGDEKKMEDLRNTGEKVEVQYPETFKFENDGDYLQGVVRTIGMVNTKDGDALRLVVNDELQSPWTVWANGVLEGKLREAQVAEGDIIGIEFTGWQKGGKTNFKYKNYELYVQRRAAE